MKAPAELTVQQMDVLLCLLSQNAVYGKRWISTASVAEDHYGQTSGNKVQGRNAATHNVLSNLMLDGYVSCLSCTDERPVHWQITAAGLASLLPCEA